MNLFAISGLLIGVTCLPLGIFVFLKGKKKRVNQISALFDIAATIWGFGGYKIATTINDSAAFFWWRLTHIGVIFIPVFFFHFICKLLGIKRKKTLIVIYSLALLFLVFNFTPWFIVNMRWVFNQFYYDSPPGIVYPFFVAFFFGLTILGHIELLKGWKRTTGIVRTQVKYLFLATAVGFIGGGTAFLPVFKIDIYPILNFTVPLYPIITTYAILRYRLMDIRFVMGKASVYFFSFLAAVGVGFLLLFWNSRLAQPLSPSAFLPIAVVVIILFYQLFFRLFERFASRYFYYTFYSSQKVLTELGGQLTRILDLHELTGLIVNTLVQTMKLDRTVILLRDESGKYRILKNVGFKEENGISLVKDNFLTSYLQITKKPLVYEELALTQRDIVDQKERQDVKKLQENMKRIEASVCLPLFQKEKIFGFIVLGRKVSGDAYYQQDLELLTNLANQASIALQNARLYGEVEDLSQNLQEKVDEQTKELKTAYDNLKRIDQAKTEFISMASHQLRTPLTAIKGYLSMALEGDYGVIPQKMQKPLDGVFNSNERLIKIVNDLLNLSRIELGKMEMEKTTVHLEDLVKSCCEEMKIRAEEKKLKLTYKTPQTSLPTLSLDELKIRQVILNLIDNAIRYTHKGEIAIDLVKKANSVLIKIKDTGEGLTSKEKQEIFSGFTRGSAGRDFFIEGAGLGLHIAQKYLELHQGKIWAESPGKGKGSTFYVELPIK